MEDSAAPLATHPLAGAAELQIDGRNRSSASSSEGLSLSTSVTESEEEQLRQLEEDILAATAAAAAGCDEAAAKVSGGARSAAAALLRHGRRGRRWQQRILAVAAFKTEGQRRRLLEEDILSVAASVCSEIGSMASDRYSLDEPWLQPQQHRRLTQNSSEGPSRLCRTGNNQSGCWSTPVFPRNHGVFTAEDEQVMNLIIGLGPEAAS